MLDIAKKVASSHYRLLAIVADIIIIIFAIRVILIPFLYPLNWNQLSFAEIIGKLAPACLAFYLLLLLKDFKKTQSIGRWIFKIEVCRVEEKFPLASYKTCLVRNLFLILLPIELPFFLFDRLHRRLADKYCGTIVMSKNSPFAIRQLTNRVICILLIGAIFWLINYLTSPIFVSKTSYYQTIIANWDNTNELKDRKIEKISYFKEIYNDQNSTVLTFKLDDSLGLSQILCYFDALGNLDKIKVADAK